MVCIAACLYKLGRIGEGEEILDKAYHLIRDCFSDAQWEKQKDFYMGEFRRVYEQMGLNEYKPCAY